MSSIELNNSTYEIDNLKKTMPEQSEQSSLEKAARLTKVIFPLMAIGGLSTLNLSVPVKLIAAPIVVKATQVLMESAKPLTQALIESVANLKDFFKQPLKVTVPTLLAVVGCKLLR